MTHRLEKLICAALEDNLRGRAPRPPEGSESVWNAFVALSRTRKRTAEGPEPITYAEVDAYCRLMRVPLEPRHVGILCAMDRIWLDHATGRKEAPPQDLTAAGFDAVFG
ncbi:phage tail assembly chaperone [Tranquillimonas alkanivorans]|uniref:Uncharacterized protein n=1 Tax=Tranquillimonas alkanivorans TaxID=441119 RepID=A0A1I5RVR1_9RHOB|nr:hypothetical protein [Tranquillimonas alkanivorans]SFP62554.1 hypothetical protein SAMN04488047_109115 [Tranquillimonas alkanivorans]